MTETDKKIFDHILCEYKWGLILSPYDTFTPTSPGRIPAFKSVLNESQGQLTNIDRYVKGFQEFVLAKIFPYIKDGGTYSDNINTPGIFGVENPFFTACDISIIASLRPGPMSWNSGYDDQKSWFNKNGGKIFIRISAGADSEKNLMSLLSTNFAHELTHAYDDYRSRNLTLATYKSGYANKVETMRFGCEEDRKELGRLLYLLSPLERNAIIGQIGTELQDKDTSTPKEALAALRQTHAYGHYTWIKNKVLALNRETNPTAQNLVLDTYIRWTANRGAFSEQLTYKGLLADINALFKKWERKFLHTAGKIAYTNYLKKMSSLYDSSSEDYKPGLKENKLPDTDIEKYRIYRYTMPGMNIVSTEID